MKLDNAVDFAALPEAPTGPTLLFQHPDHSVYWLGINEDTAFRCNVYLIVDGNQALIVDPGNRQYFPQVRERVATILPPEQVSGMILCHQDPDVAASMRDWLELNPSMTVYASPRTNVLLPHYGVHDYNFYDVEAEPLLQLPSGQALQFVGAPFLHSPMAFASFDQASGFLLSGDVFAAVDSDWRLNVTDWEEHAAKLDLFHIDYMASSVAARGFARKMSHLPISAILPQHGSVIPQRFVPNAIAYLNELQCGLDLLYPDID